MKILGISGSPRNGTTCKLVREVLNGAECETEFVSLAGLQIGPCIACLRCVRDNICKVRDDMMLLREKIIAADAYVIGAANYYGMLNGLAHCFLERFYQFRHREEKLVVGKLGVAVGVGGSTEGAVTENIRSFFRCHEIECVGEVSAKGVSCCFSCGYGETCKSGSIYKHVGPETKISQLKQDLSKQPDRIETAHSLGRMLSERLKYSSTATQEGTKFETCSGPESQS